MADHEDKDPRKRKNDPFDEFMRGMGLDPAGFDRLFDEMQRALGKMLSEGGFEPGKPYMHGFNFKIGPDGKPHISEFGNRPRPRQGRVGVSLSDEREPPTDVIEGVKDVAVTLEMPGVDKKDIDLRATERRLEISVDTEKRKYHKVLDMPAPVKPDTTKATYKNGVLDVVIQKKEPGKGEGGLKVKVE